MMIDTFSYTTKTKDKSYHHTVYSADIEGSVKKWITHIEDFQSQVYSFNKNEVENIKQQFLNGQLKMQLDKEPYFLAYKVGDGIQVVNIIKVDKGEPDFIAKVAYLATAQGGRQGYVGAGYRGHIKFDGRNERTSGEQLFIEKDKVFPGETATAEIRLASPQLFSHYLFAGQYFEIGEGSKVVGHGKIITITNPDLLCTSL